MLHTTLDPRRYGPPKPDPYHTLPPAADCSNVGGVGGNGESLERNLPSANTSAQTTTPGTISAPARLTDEQIDAAIEAALVCDPVHPLAANPSSRYGMDPTTAKYFVTVLRSSMGQDTGGFSDGIRVALLEALQHASIDVERYAARAFGRHSRSNPRAILQLLRDEAAVTRLRRLLSDAEAAPTICIGLLELYGYAREHALLDCASVRTIMALLCDALTLRPADHSIARDAVRVLHASHQTGKLASELLTRAAAGAALALQCQWNRSDSAIAHGALKLIQASCETASSASISALLAAGAAAAVAGVLLELPAPDLTATSLHAAARMVAEAPVAADALLEAGIVDGLIKVLLAPADTHHASSAIVTYDARMAGQASQPRADDRLKDDAVMLAAHCAVAARTSNLRHLLRAEVVTGLEAQLTAILQGESLPTRSGTDARLVAALERLSSLPCGPSNEPHSIFADTRFGSSLAAACVLAVSKREHVGLAKGCCIIIYNVCACKAVRAAVHRDMSGVVVQFLQRLAADDLVRDWSDAFEAACRLLHRLAPAPGDASLEHIARRLSIIAAVVRSCDEDALAPSCESVCWAAWAYAHTVVGRWRFLNAPPCFGDVIHALVSVIRRCPEDSSASDGAKAALTLRRLAEWKCNSLSLHMRADNVGEALVEGLHGPAVEDSGFAASALAALAALCDDSAEHQALLALGADRALLIAVGLHVSSAPVCLAACDLLSRLALGPADLATRGCLTVASVWTEAIEQMLPLHDGVAASALRSLALFVTATGGHGMEASSYEAMRAAAHGILRRDSGNMEVVRSGSLLLYTLQLAEAGTPAAAGATAAEASGRLLPRLDRRQQINAAALWAAARGDVAAFGDDAFSGGYAAVEWDAVLHMVASTGHQAAADAILSQTSTSRRVSLSELVDKALHISIARDDAGLAAHLLHHWQPELELSQAALSTGGRRYTFWLAAAAAQRHGVELLELLLSNAVMAPRASPAGPAFDPSVVKLLDGEGEDLELLERLARNASRPLEHDRLGVDCRPISIAVIQGMLLDTCAEAEAAGKQALAEAAAQKRLLIVQALLEDPRVDPLQFATEKLSGTITPPLHPAVRTILMRQPAVARNFAIPSDSRALTATGAEAAPLLLHKYTSIDVTAMCAAAWRRRRAAVLARTSEPL